MNWSSLLDLVLVAHDHISDGLELTSGKWLREDISQVLRGLYPSSDEISINSDALPDVMMLDVDVFSSSVMDSIIIRHADRALVIDEESRGLALSTVDMSEEASDPHDVSSFFCSSNIFCFGAAESNG
ncbi:MAG: hypothetical protein P4L81_00395 [Candidatus Pacebacteria bacterium]|nr:hypothetical protein [Candidatus Paceibacterota bacterium]